MSYYCMCGCCYEGWQKLYTVYVCNVHVTGLKIKFSILFLLDLYKVICHGIRKITLYFDRDQLDVSVTSCKEYYGKDAKQPRKCKFPQSDKFTMQMQMSAYPSQEFRPLKKPRLGPPDVYPQEPKQKEVFILRKEVNYKVLRPMSYRPL